MKITKVAATPVNVPFVAPYVYARGSIASVTKTIVEVETDEGLIGLGEAADGDQSRLIVELGARLVGLDPMELNSCEAQCVPKLSYTLWNDLLALRRAFGAIEMALWDIRGKANERPLHSLLGGAVRFDIAFTEYFSPRLARNGQGGESTPQDLAAYCARMVEEYDAPTFEGKVAVGDLRSDVETVKEVRAAIGPDRMLRLDANCGWTVATAREAIKRLEPYGIRNIEDPVNSFEEMTRLRAGTALSFSAHDPDLRRAVELGVPDFFVLNLVELGGIRRTVEFIEACEQFGIGFWFHSGDTGIASAAYLHVAAALEPVREPSQALFHWAADDVIEEGPFCPRHGVIRVPDGPGLGVTLDRVALHRCHERFRAEGSFPSAGGHAAHPGRLARQ